MRETLKNIAEGVNNFFGSLKDMVSGLKNWGQEKAADVEQFGAHTGPDAAPKKMFDSLTALAPGLKNFGAEVSAEIKRQGTQGQMELASALFNGNAFVPYGPGQYTPSPEHGLNSHAMDHNASQSSVHGVDQAAEHQQEVARER